MGRPRIKLTDRDLEQIEEMAGLGLTQAQIAAILGLSAQTIYRRKQDEPKVLAALERGKANAQRHVGKALYHKACEGDVGAIRWWEMTRANRTEKQDTNLHVETSDPKGQLADFLARIAERRGSAEVPEQPDRSGS